MVPEPISAAPGGADRTDFTPADAGGAGPSPADAGWADPAEIVVFDDAEDPDIWVKESPRREIVVADPDPAWPERFRRLEVRIRGALGRRALLVEHVGSTSVPRLPAKPVIDIDLDVTDPRDEDSYRGRLAGIGYDLVIREPNWHEHRAFRHQDAGSGEPPMPLSNLHVFGPHCREVARHRLFRNWLRTHPVDLKLYAATKRSAAGAANAAGESVMDYNRRKQDVIRGIYQRIFGARGWV